MDVKVDGSGYRIVREQRDGGSYEYRFVLYVGGEEVVTASDVARRGGFEFEDIDNWTSMMKVFAEAFMESRNVDVGVEAVLEEYQLER